MPTTISTQNNNAEQAHKSIKYNRHTQLTSDCRSQHMDERTNTYNYEKPKKILFFNEGGILK